jgi:hypothetical protein
LAGVVLDTCRSVSVGCWLERFVVAVLLFIARLAFLGNGARVCL